MTRWRCHAPLVLAAAAALACSGASEPGDAQPVRLLFIGNSLTYVNDLPRMLQGLAAADGRAIAYRQVLGAGFSLEDHWLLGNEARNAIAEGTADLVVLQQGPSGTPQGRALLLEYAEVFAQAIRDAGGRPAFYAVWPDDSRPTAFDSVATSYRLAAEAVDGMLFPVGTAWQVVWQQDATVDLYGPDGFHPSTAATYLAALVMYAVLFDRSPAQLPSRFAYGSGPIGNLPFDHPPSDIGPDSTAGAVVIPDDLAASLRSAAWNAARTAGRR